MTYDLEKVWLAALPFEKYRAQLRVHSRIFCDHYERLAFVREIEKEAPFPPVRILILTEEWCPDSVLNVPLVARLTEASPGAELRIVRRDDHLELSRNFPGRDGASRLPTVIFLGTSGQSLGYWAERCQRDHEWMAQFTANDPLPELQFVEDRPAPLLLAWMERRLKAQRPLYETMNWRDVREELRRSANL